MTSQVLGVLLLFRHGDRQGFYQSPTSYTPTGTAITPLGEVQAYQLGQQLRARYLDPASPDAIEGINSGLIDNSQLYFSADAGGEGGVIYNSAVAVSQGLYPVSSASSTTLANGTSVTSPLGGYQYLPIESLEVDQDYSLESWTECPAYTADNAAWYQSDAFKAKAEENADFLNSLAPIVGGRNVTLQNMWNIFDYINVNYIHNATFLQETPATVREQARALADWHEYTSFSDVKPDAIGNIAGRAMLPEMIGSLQTFTNATQSQKMRAFAISYKPFASIFNMTGVAETYPQLAGVVDYTACMALEVRRESVTNSYTVTMQFKNGTADADFAPYNMFGSADAAYDLTSFINTLEPYGISSLGQWCNECQNTDSRGCATINAVNVSRADNGPASTTGTHDTSPLASGFIGAVVALALAAAGLAVLFRMGMIAVGKKSSPRGWKGNSEGFSLPAYERSASNNADYK